MSKQILEQVLEHILNKEEGKASERLHQYFVEKGRYIYEGLIQRDEFAEDDTFEIEDNPEEDFADEITANQDEINNEEMFSEEEDMDDEDMDGVEDLEGEEDMDDMDSEEDMDDMDSEEDMDDMDGEEDKMSAVQDAVLDVEDALDELKSLFAELQSDMGGSEDMGPEKDDTLGESTDLMAVTKPTPGDNGQNVKSPIPANSGQRGMTAKPVGMGGNSPEKGGSAMSPKDMSISAGNRPGQKKAPTYSQVKAPAKPEAATGRSPIAGK